MQRVGDEPDPVLVGAAARSDRRPDSQPACLSGIEDASVENKQVSLSPIPVNNSLFITTAEAATVQIYNSVGALMMKHKCEAGTSELNTETLTAGMYFVNILFADKTVAARKFVKE